ncbi:hypothetical protein GCM10010921_21670 [Microbacterium album]|uniref:Uncharacterized protein n=1 Tax=Microbacterium album TaxID=2053191 RepID=A0A917IFQ7_9MICO|nr:hypothetical protein GCM10010921_21670 [Microbacterium album]
MTRRSSRSSLVIRDRTASISAVVSGRAQFPGYRAPLESCVVRKEKTRRQRRRVVWPHGSTRHHGAGFVIRDEMTFGS